MTQNTSLYNLYMWLNIHQYNNYHTQLNIQCHNSLSMMMYMKCHNLQYTPNCILLCNHFYKWLNIQ